MSFDDAYLEMMGVYCRRSHSLGSLDGRNPFPLPGDEPHWSRDRLCDIQHIKLELTIDFENKRIAGTATHTIKPINDGLTNVEFDAAELQINSVRLASGTPLKYTHEDKKLLIHLPSPLNATDQASISIAYEGSPRRGLYFNAPDSGYPDRPKQVWTQGEDEDSHYWFPCYDFPNDRITSEVIATVPHGWVAISNGKLYTVRETKLGTIYHWIQDKPHSSYLVSLVAGEYTEIQDQWDGTPIIYYSPPGREDDTRRAFSKTPKIVQFFSEKIGVPYPWDKYSQVTVADFIFGGMENTSATTMTDFLLHDERAHLDFSTDSIVAHELAHQWWGDLLTCREWAHAWLNEGFATYFDLLFKEHDLGVDEFRYAAHQNAETYIQEDSGHYRRPIVTNVYRQPIDLFDRHLYEKGGMVLHMLRFVLGDALFWKALHHYCVKHRGGNVITQDLQRAIEEATGKNLDWFFDQWVYKGGHPDFKITYNWDEEHKVVELTVAQTQPVDALTSLFRMPVDVAVVTSKGRKTIRIQISQKEQTFYIALDEKPLIVQFDPGYWCLKTLDFTKPKEMLLYQIKGDEDVIGRIQAAQGLAKLSTQDCIDALKRAVMTDKFWGVQAEAAKALGTIKSEAAMNALIQCLSVKHPKARRAVANALGEFKEKAAFDALLPILEHDESYFVEAAAARAAAKTKQPEAFEKVKSVLGRSSFYDAISAEAFNGFAELKDERAIPIAKEWSKYGKPVRARDAAIASLGKLGEGKSDVVEFLVDYVDDPGLRTRLTTINALQELKDDKAIPFLSRRITRELDGRVVRRCREAITAIAQGKDRGEDVKRLRDEVEKLQEENRKLKDRLDKLEAKASGNGKS